MMFATKFKQTLFVSLRLGSKYNKALFSLMLQISKVNEDFYKHLKMFLRHGGQFFPKLSTSHQSAVTKLEHAQKLLSGEMSYEDYLEIHNQTSYASKLASKKL